MRHRTAIRRGTPQEYEAWYHTPRGRWIGDVEYALLMRLLRPASGASLLEVGCGTGHFARRFAAQGLAVTALDPDPAMLAYARAQGGRIAYLRGDARALPFPDRAFDHCAAIMSLCFIADPVSALRELLRVARRGVVLGLLNRASLLHYRKHGRGGYRGARWDTAAEVRRWVAEIGALLALTVRSAVFVPGGGRTARLVEACLPNRCLCGGFLAVRIEPL